MSIHPDSANRKSGYKETLCMLSVERRQVVSDTSKGKSLNNWIKIHDVDKISVFKLPSFMGHIVISPITFGQIPKYLPAWRPLDAASSILTDCYRC